MAAIALMLVAAADSRGSTDLAVPLTGEPGDAGRGKAVFLDSERGDCIICHAVLIPGIQGDAFGDFGPPLTGVASRLSVPELRQRIVNPKVINPDTVMPSYFVKQGFTRVDPKYAGKTILTAQEVEDLVAYLATLQ